MDAIDTLERPKGLDAGKALRSHGGEKPDAPASDYDALISEILDRHDGNAKAATPDLIAEIEADPELYRIVIGVHTHKIAHTYLITRANLKRIDSWRGVQKKSAPPTTEVHKSNALLSQQQRRAVVESECARLLDMPMPVTGLPLKDATSSDLLDAAKYHRTMTKSHEVKAKFYDRVAKTVGKKTVGDAFSETKLREIQSSVT